jgi:hypothetical protein
MATTLDDGRIIWIDNWPGVARTGWLPPADSSGNIFTNSTHHNVATPIGAEVGDKVVARDPTHNQWVTFIYLQYGTSQDTAAAKQIATAQVTSSAFDNKVTNDASSQGTPGLSCVLLSAMTDDYYGWFQCGGKPAVGFVSGLDGDYTTDDSVAAAGPVSLVASTNLWVLEAMDAVTDMAVAFVSSTD